VGASGSVVEAKGKYWVSDNVLIVIVSKNNDYQFIKYKLISLNISDIANKNAQPLITATQIKNIITQIPKNLLDQTAIANFLDKKTAKIDTLIEKDKILIELLKEKRIALINHAVTKGLDPNVKMKDSGVDWIGEIPEGWEVDRLKYVSHINKEKLDDNTDPNFKLNYLDISNVDSEGDIFQIEEQYFEDAPSRARRIPKENDTIISTVRTYLKAIAYLEKTPRDLIVSTGFAVLEPFKKFIPKYLFYAVTSEKFIQRVIADSKGVAYPAINPPELGQIYVIVPSKSEQQKIVDYLDKATSKIDKTIKLIENKIKLLEEYKKSLIHHTVTGKMDVRGVEV
jgi:Restriction endonuclease S subunits